ncbi:TPA: hypothetical protein DEG21_01390 [Patescibacteria group bacterium]|nr:hypothetical protein [Candidatus Gracilibacteria bacterium]HBY74547.1 hypothetical protein [Candidatus Gracilibacteria bacterium]
MKNSVLKTIFPDSISSVLSVSLIFLNLSHLLISAPPFTFKSFVAITVSQLLSTFQLQSLTTSSTLFSSSLSQL